MKKLLLLIPLVLFFACSSEEGENAPPECNIVNPSNNSTFTVDDDLVIEVEAVDTDGTIAVIEILINEIIVATSNSSPFEYKYNLDGIIPGTFILRTVVIDDMGAEISEEIQITVNPAQEVFTDSRDGNVYRYVTIGDQIWMADNLAYLPSVSPPTEGSDSTPLYYVLAYEGNDESAAKSEGNYSLYGALYNWEAAVSCCPEGWHLPSDNDWIELEDYIVNDQNLIDQGFYNWGSVWYNMGMYLMHTSGWELRHQGMNTYSFSALPAGGVTFTEVEDCGVCFDEAAEWWTSTPEGDFSITRNIWSEHPLMFARHINRPRDFGLSVRCVKD